MDYVDQRKFKRGDIWLAKEFLFPYEKYGKERPVLILQNNEDNTNPHYPTIYVAPITTRLPTKQYPTDFLVQVGEGGLDQDSRILLGQVQPFLKANLTKKLGRIKEPTLKEIGAILLMNLGFIERPKRRKK